MDNNIKREHEFAILHEFEDTQFLIDTTYNHETNEYELRFKFWASNINGYANYTLYWSDDKEADFKETFEKFKTVEYCRTMINGINQ